MINPALNLPMSIIDEFCRNHRIKMLALFGSALRDDFRADSDVDLLVEFAPDAEPGLFELAALEAELESLLGRPVDLVEKQAVEQSRNYIRRHQILTHMEPIYVAR